MKWTPNLRQVFEWDTAQRNGYAMNETKKRNTHLPEFKAKVGLEAVRGVKTVNQIAQEYGVHPVQVGQWKREIQAQAKTLFEGKRAPNPLRRTAHPIDCTEKSVDSRWNSIGSTKKSGITRVRHQIPFSPVFDPSTLTKSST